MASTKQSFVKVPDYEKFHLDLDADIAEAKSGEMTESKARIVVNMRRNQLKFLEERIKYNRLMQGLSGGD